MSAMPLRLASDEVFARVRQSFVAAGYDGPAIDRQLHGDPKLMSAFVHGNIVTGFDAAQTLIRVFSGGSVRASELRILLGAGIVQDLCALDLLEDSGADLLRPTVRLRPMLGLYIAADLHTRYEEHNADFVFPPDGSHTHEYISHLPGRFAGSFLEACGGSGVAALIAASHGATHASSFDISPRCTHFAAFSARLSGIGNFTAATGDGFAPAAGQTYDCIAMHPPYTPVSHSEFVFSDGGQDGEQITRMHIAGLPAHLNPGGRLYARGMATDRKGEPLEARLRKWLGEHAGEFDIVLHSMRYIAPVHVFRNRQCSPGSAPPTREEIVQWLDMIDALRIERFLVCAFIIQRHDAPRQPFTVRRQRNEFTSPLDLTRMLDWHTLMATGKAADIVLRSRLHNSGAVLTVRNRIEDGEWATESQSLGVARPYPIDSEVGDLAAYIVPRLDGRTGLEIAQELGIGDTTSFGAHLAELAGLGFLRVEQ
ncbi:MAG: hypothetical protein JNK48_23515 [Bryobacterales bacterium]|nr:hypothetical protein [Bryobacterales bacterium]